MQENISNIIAIRLTKLLRTHRVALMSGPYNTKELKQTVKKPLTSKTQKKISIVIYSYNPDIELLNKCLDSIKNQSIGYNNVEVIIVENSNTKLDCQDISIHIIDLDKRYKEGYAKNIGLEHATGEYVTFMDYRDQYISHSVLEDVYNVLKNEKADFLMGFHDIDEEKVYKHFIDKYYKIFVGSEIRQKQFLFKHSATLPAKFFKRSFLLENDIWFKEYNTAEDTLFYTMSLIQADSMVFYSNLIYKSGISEDANFTYVDDLDISTEGLYEYIDAIYERYYLMLQSGIKINELPNELDYIIDMILKNISITKKNVNDVIEHFVELTKIIVIYKVLSKYETLYNAILNNDTKQFIKILKLIKKGIQ